MSAQDILGRVRGLTYVFSDLINNRILEALVDLLIGLKRQRLAVRRDTILSRAYIHRTLQRITFSSKDIVGMLPVARSETTRCQCQWGRARRSTHGSPILKTKGWLPSTGHISAELKRRVSHMISMNNRGTLTGCVGGQSVPKILRPWLSGSPTG